MTTESPKPTKIAALFPSGDIATLGPAQPLHPGWIGAATECAILSR
jgi:hypothetical protein